MFGVLGLVIRNPAIQTIKILLIYNITNIHKNTLKYFFSIWLFTGKRIAFFTICIQHINEFSYQILDSRQFVAKSFHALSWLSCQRIFTTD